MTHTITHADDLYRCPDCAWRAVQCADGRIVQTSAGAAGHDHLGQAIAQRDQARQAQAARIALIVDRLEAQHRFCVALPRSDGLHGGVCEELKTGRCVCSHPDGYILTDRQLQRLVRCVMTEYQL